MKWRGLERNRNVEDRRRARPSSLVAGAAVLDALFLGGSSGGGGLDLEGLRQGLEAQQPAPTPLNPANL